MQLKKLAVICNGCFWLTLIFQYWKAARGINPDLLNTIVILGIFAIIINLTWLLFSLVKKTKPKTVINHAGQPITAEMETKNTNVAMLLFKWFNILSFAAQLVFLYFKYS